MSIQLDLHHETLADEAADEKRCIRRRNIAEEFLVCTGRGVRVSTWCEIHTSSQDGVAGCPQFDRSSDRPLQACLRLRICVPGCESRSVISVRRCSTDCDVGADSDGS
ncbi:unannotated protein [freshwater metagenome]|uniref:Unannotated protein n=1 Tax=freshwater metagenome TaxID=449393 RepID=A0A6J7KUU6_9ZZZZ